MVFHKKPLSKYQHIKLSDMEDFGINTQENYSNFNLVTLLSNGQMMQCEDGVKSHGESPKFFRIPQNCTFNILRLTICSNLEVPITTTINKLYFRRPTLNEEGAIRYDALQISTNDHVAEMIHCKSHQLINTII